MPSSRKLCQIGLLGAFAIAVSAVSAAPAFAQDVDAAKKKPATQQQKAEKPKSNMDKDTTPQTQTPGSGYSASKDTSSVVNTGGFTMRAYSRMCPIGVFTAVALIAAAPAFAGDNDAKTNKATHQKANTGKPSNNSASTGDTTPDQRMPTGY